MSTTRTRIFTVTLALALLATAAAAGTTVAQSDDPLAEFEHDGGTLLVQNASEQTIRGETSLEAGSEVLIRVRSGADAEKPFLKTATATVSEDGTFAAAFDFSELPSDTSFTVSARANGTDLAEADGRIVDEMSETTTTTAETTANDGGQPGFGVVAALVALCGAALVALHSQRD